MSAYIRTFTGKMINLIDPQPEEIDIVDIATGLSFAPRFAGQIGFFHSVAEHCWWVSNYVDEQYALAGLLHDASEAYMCDIPSPFKQYLPEYKFYEDKLMRVIADVFEFQYPFHEQIHEADKHALERERVWTHPTWSHYACKKNYLRRFHEL